MPYNRKRVGNYRYYKKRRLGRIPRNFGYPATWSKLFRNKFKNPVHHLTCATDGNNNALTVNAALNGSYYSKGSTGCYMSTGAAAVS